MTARILPQCLFLLAATGIGLCGGGDVAMVMLGGWPPVSEKLPPT